MSVDYIELFFNVEAQQWRGKMEICVPFGDHIYLTVDKGKIAFDEETPCKITEEIRLYAEKLKEKVEGFSMVKEKKDWSRCVLIEEGIHQGSMLYWARYRYDEFKISFAYNKNGDFQQFHVYAEQLKIENHDKVFEYVQLKNADQFLGKENIEQFKLIVRSKSNQRLRLLNW